MTSNGKGSQLTKGFSTCHFKEATVEPSPMALWPKAGVWLFLGVKFLNVSNLQSFQGVSPRGKKEHMTSLLFVLAKTAF